MLVGAAVVDLEAEVVAVDPVAGVVLAVVRLSGTIHLHADEERLGSSHGRPP
jgi:hypothetical protein